MPLDGRRDDPVAQAGVGDVTGDDARPSTMPCSRCSSRPTSTTWAPRSAAPRAIRDPSSPLAPTTATTRPAGDGAHPPTPRHPDAVHKRCARLEPECGQVFECRLRSRRDRTPGVAARPGDQVVVHPLGGCAAPPGRRRVGRCACPASWVAPTCCSRRCATTCPGRPSAARCTTARRRPAPAVFYGEREPLPHPALDESREALSPTTRAELGEPFTTAGLASTATGTTRWRGTATGSAASRDRGHHGRHPLGRRPRDLVLRPRGGGASMRVRAATATCS